MSRGSSAPPRCSTRWCASTEAVLDQLATLLYDAGRIADTYADRPFSDRFIQIEHETNETNAQFFDFSLPQGGVRHDTPMWLGPAVFRALTDPPLLDAVESIIGGEIYSNPVQHVRIKSPERLGARDETTHRRSWGRPTGTRTTACCSRSPTSSNILTVWFSLSDADVEHGCLQVIPGATDWDCSHTARAGTGSSRSRVRLAGRDAALPLPTRRGDVIFLHMRDDAQLPRQCQRRDPLELRPAVQPDRSARPAAAFSPVSSRAAGPIPTPSCAAGTSGRRRGTGLARTSPTPATTSRSTAGAPTPRSARNQP